MGFTRSTGDISVHQKLGDYPNQDNGLTPEELKKRYDLPAETLQKDLNKLEEELEAVIGASNVGATSLDENDTSANNVQAKLEYILNESKQVVLSQIPNGTITEAKLDNNFSNELARKNGELQTNLNAEKLEGSTKSEIVNSIGSFSDIRNVTVSGALASNSNTWAETVKGEKLTFNLENYRYFLIKATLVESTFKNDVLIENTHLYDAVLGSIVPIGKNEILIKGEDFNSIAPNVYTIARDIASSAIGGGPERTVGFSYIEKNQNSLSLQPVLFNISGQSYGTNTATIRIDVTSFLSRI